MKFHYECIDIFHVDGTEWVDNPNGKDGPERKMDEHFCVAGEIFSIGDVIEIIEEEVKARGCLCWINGIHLLDTTHVVTHRVDKEKPV